MLFDKKLFARGVRDAIPISLGYFAVAFSLGITARNIGLNAFQGFLLSILNNASAGQYAGLETMAASAPYIETALIILIANARYLLMSAALSQKFSPDTPFFHRFLIGFDITDEVFGLAIAYPGYLSPTYMYGAILTVLPGWAFGTSVGVIAGNILPEILVNAFSVAIYGMFLAIIIPPCRGNKVITGAVIISFILSALCQRFLPISGGMKTILLTILIAGACAVLFPIRDEEETPPEDSSSETTPPAKEAVEASTNAVEEESNHES